MPRKTTIIGVIIIAGFVGGLFLLKGGGIGTGSGPEAAVKGFYQAVDEGDMSEAEKHIDPAKNIENDFGNPAWGCGYEDLKGRIKILKS